MKVVISRGWGGFGLSRAAVLRIRELGSELAKNTILCSPDMEPAGYLYHIDRTDPVLIAVVEEMGMLANGVYAQLVVADIPDNVEWEIQAYDGSETIVEKHRIFYPKEY